MVWFLNSTLRRTQVHTAFSRLYSVMLAALASFWRLFRGIAPLTIPSTGQQWNY